jgi:hypothetical protein
MKQITHSGDILLNTELCKNCDNDICIQEIDKSKLDIWRHFTRYPNSV